MKLTEPAIRGLKPKEARYEVGDDITAGLRVRVGTSGKKVFLHRFFADGKAQAVTIGQFPDVSLAKARRTVEEQRETLASGMSVKEHAAVVKPDAITMRDVAAAFKADPRFRANRTYADRCRRIDNHIVPALGHILVADLTRNDVRRLIDDIVSRGSGVMARDILSLTKQVVGFALENGWISAYPLHAMKSPVGEVSRDRVLSRDEMRRFWHYASHPSIGRNAIPRCLLFILSCGQRKSECAFIRESEIDRERGLWVIPKDRVKNGRAHVVPMLPLHWELLGEPHPVSGLYFHSPKAVNPDRLGMVDVRAIDRHVAYYRGRVGDERWIPHDMRRSMATYMRELGVPRDDVKLVLNHTFGDVTSVYDRYANIPEKRRALEAWHEFLKAEVIGRWVPASAAQ